MGNGKGTALPFLGGTCGLSAILAGIRNCPGRDAGDRLEVTAGLALAREAGVRGDLCQGEVAAVQELLRPFGAAGDELLVRRQPGGPLE
jgi:hypothetical protein